VRCIYLLASTTISAEKLQEIYDSYKSIQVIVTSALDVHKSTIDFNGIANCG
jgi:hypothetical protein